MGQGIAAHLANVGIPSYLFDIVPGEPSPDEAAQGLTLADQKVRNRLALAGLASMSKARPPLLYRKELAGLVNPCNFDDDATKLAECDWIVEAVVERLDIKQKVFTMVDGHRRPGSIVSSNTSGLSVESMAQGRSDDFRRRWSRATTPTASCFGPWPNSESTCSAKASCTPRTHRISSATGSAHSE
jgi:3-hydroxyacyl-CoA dehydrogenase